MRVKSIFAWQKVELRMPKLLLSLFYDENGKVKGKKSQEAGFLPSNAQHLFLVLYWSRILCSRIIDRAGLTWEL